MGEPCVGIYWTFPVNWAGFRDLPPHPDAAAAASRTIRYQRERIRRHVEAEGAHLVAEIAFMDTRPDRATDAVRDVLYRHAPSFGAVRPTLLAVCFEDAHHWRRNPHIVLAAEALGLPLVALPPDPITIGATTFDPARHFAAWRRRDATAMARLRLAAEEALRSALAETPPGDGRWARVAHDLNTRQVRTIRGGAWTPENVRKLVARREAR